MTEKIKRLYVELGEPIEDVFNDPSLFLSDEQFNYLTQRYKSMVEVKEGRQKIMEKMVGILLQQYNMLGITQENATNQIDQMLLASPTVRPCKSPNASTYVTTTEVLCGVEKRMKEIQELRVGECVSC